ncbi:major facilitator superfamily domain-containing protein [Aspergillus cavernicola]|uniref:Major facilitator superfamily domain-containing protein n=1 Tax=Aspergillus cavernicola TaxID=176166 RepID=A0ABR4IJR6_9EURO
MIVLCCITYLVTYIDKAMLGYAAVFGLKEDLDLKGEEYSWLASMFYFGYLAFEYPSTFMMQKLPSFLGLRFVLGTLESLFDTCLSPHNSHLWWSTFLGVANSFGSLLAFLIGYIHGRLASCQYQFIILGAISTAWGLFMMFSLAESPKSATWLKEEEKERNQILEALTDPKTCLLFLCRVCTQVINGAASNFGSPIIQGFSYSSLVTTLFQIPYGMVILVSNVSAMHLQHWLPDQKRCLVAAIYVCPAVAGAVGLHTIPRNHSMALLVCYWVYSLHALFFISYYMGNIVGPFGFKSSEAPKYTSGIVTMLVAYCVEVVLLLVYALYMILLNKRKDAVLDAQGITMSNGV